jgi:26S proteasome regulatory subunit N1
MMKRQLAYILARQQVTVETDDETLLEILNNTQLSSNFKRFGQELSVTEPKSLEDIYKSHLDGARAPANVDSAKQNLAGTFVNAFVNAGFGNDKLMVEAEEGQSWIYKNKDHGASFPFSPSPSYPSEGRS